MTRSTLARWAAYVAVLPICAGISYATGDHLSWFVTGACGVVLAIALPLLAWSYLRLRGADGLRGD